MSDEKRAPAGPNLNHYDELIEVLREMVEDATGMHDSWRCEHPDRYPACTEDSPQCPVQRGRSKALALLRRLPNQQKAAIRQPPTLPE